MNNNKLIILELWASYLLTKYKQNIAKIVLLNWKKAKNKKKQKIAILFNHILSCLKKFFLIIKLNASYGGSLFKGIILQVSTKIN